MKRNLLVFISLMIIVSATMIVPGMAARQGLRLLQVILQQAIDITVTGSISNWALAVGSNTDSSSVDLDVSSNKIGWTVAVKDGMDGSKITGTQGKMANWTGSAWGSSGNLAAAMHVAGASVSTKTTGADVALSGSDQTIETGLDIVSSQSMAITIGQTVAYTDPALPGSNVYRIIVTFTDQLHNQRLAIRHKNLFIFTYQVFHRANYERLFSKVSFDNIRYTGSTAFRRGVQRRTSNGTRAGPDCQHLYFWQHILQCYLPRAVSTRIPQFISM